MVQLNSTQQQAVLHFQGPLLVLAGAGSGKTRIVTERILYLIERGVDPSQIVAVTFTNKAAREMEERVKTKSSSRVLIATFHSLGVRILRESIEVLGWPRNFTIYDEEDSLKLLKVCMEELAIKDPDVGAKDLRHLISTSKNQLVIADKSAKHEQVFFPSLYARYTEKLKEASAVDFDDLLFLTARLFLEHPDILAKYQERWPYLLIDEYQDTNHAQYTIAKLLVAKTQNLFAVGDPDQSIYSWRGANIRNILNFQKDFPGAPLVRLEQNFRSRGHILEAANAVIQNNASRLEKNLWTDRGAGPKIQLYIADDERLEASFVAQKVSQLSKTVPLKEMVVFYRTNFQSRPFEDALLRQRIPYTIVGGLSFYHRKEVKDILAFLRMIQNPSDTVSFLRTINIPKRGLGEATLEKVILYAGSRPILEATAELVQNGAVKLSSKQKESLKEYLEIITTLRSEPQELVHLVAETVRRTRYIEYLKDDKETYEDRKENVDELVAKAAEWETYAEEATLISFLEELSLKSQLDEASLGGERLSLMTVHNGKGLEFDQVFLVGLEEDLFPHANSRESFEGLEEERRLCYVGMTRAKEQLTLTCARGRFLWGSWRMMRPSRFLNEIPKNCLQRLA